VLNTDPTHQFDELRTQFIDEIKSTFPMDDPSGEFEVRVSGITAHDEKGIDDIKGQLAARMKGQSWSVPVLGTVEIVDKATGKVHVTRDNVNLAEIPKTTRHYSYIVDGKEKILRNQWRLKPGAYVKPTERDGEFKAQFQLSKGKRFEIVMDPATGSMSMDIGNKIPVYSVLQAAGVSDEAMKKAWGAEAFESNKKKSNPEKDLAKFYKQVHGSAMPTGVTPKMAVESYFQSTQVDPDVMKTTLGKAHDHVNEDGILRASSKLLNVSAGKVDSDPIDALHFKELWTPTDHFVDQLRTSKKGIHTRIMKSLAKPKVREAILAGHSSAIRNVVMPDLFRDPVVHVFAKDGIGTLATQTNPLSMLADRSQVTIMGDGGVKSDHALSDSSRAVDPSQLGFLDPVFTPEGSPGTMLHLTSGTQTKDRQPLVRLYNLKTGKTEMLSPQDALKKKVVLPDHVTWKEGIPSPIKSTVRISDHKGDVIDAPFKDADYTMLSPTQVFSTESNLVPFMQNDSAHRSTMSARHMTQAISIVGREAPMVQVESAPGQTFESLVAGRFLATNAATAGKVVDVQKDGITIQGADGKKHTVDIYDHFPTNDKKTMLHSTPVVKVGDTVKAGQTLADNNYSKNGQLALGTNIRTAYIANGDNHEDGIVLSESAAKKLASEHLYKPTLEIGVDTEVSRDRFLAHKDAAYTPEQFKKIGTDGLIKPGTIVQPGDPLALALNPESAPDSIDARSAARLSKKARLGFKDASLVWDGQHQGEVIRVSRKNGELEVHVKTLEPAVVGSKVSTRHSAKGIVSRIVPDSEMPHDANKQPVHMLINPVSVPGRMNPGQILETVAGKIAEKTGKPYVVKNFDGGKDYLTGLQQELKKHGLSETETLFDPKSGRKLGNITVGPHYAFQLEHQIDKKSTARHGGAYLKGVIPKAAYDQNNAPARGAKQGAQSLGSLGIYGALAAGLKDNLQEMQTLKSDKPQAEEVWNALKDGKLLPPPEVPFTFKKFEAMMSSVGLNTKKEGSSIRLVPHTDREILAMSAGVIKNPDLAVAAKNAKPESGGIFDNRVFGGLSGTRWGHIELADRMPNPVFAEPIGLLTGVKPADIPKVLSGEMTLGKHGTGPKAIVSALKAVDINKKMTALDALMKDPSVKGTALSNASKTYKALDALKSNGHSPVDAYTMRNLPVMPPVYRPYTPGTGSSTDRIDPMNQLYRRLGMVNKGLQDGQKEGVPYEATLRNRGDLYKEMQNLFGTTPKSKKALDIDITGKQVRGRELKGVLHTLAGDSPKDGFFQDRMVGKRQDYTSRATIVADPTLSPDEVGVPHKIAMEMFRPQVVNHLGRLGINQFDANKAITARTPEALRALSTVVTDHPVLLKRDPVLHAYGIVGQKVRLTKSPAIQVSPLILPPINGDIDGDTVALFVPLTEKAKVEARKIMPSQRMMSDADGEVLFTPTNESMLGLYRSTLARTGNYKKTFKSLGDAERAFKSNKVDLSERVTIGGNKTTLGRARIAQVVPEKFRAQVLTGDKPFDKNMMKEVLTHTAKHEPGTFVDVAHGLSKAGFQMAYESGHTVSLSDLKPLQGLRDSIVRKAQKAATGQTQSAREDIFTQATKDLHTAYGKHYEKNPTNISDMAFSGIKAKKPQFQGLVMAPMLVQDHLGRASKVPVEKSFSEGIGLGDYWLQSSGARRGVIQKVKTVSEPGVFTKQLIQVNIDQPITGKDCGTARGLLMSTGHKDIIDRHLASPVTLKNGSVIPVGTTVTPELLSTMQGSSVKQLAVRSPLKCRMPQGVCAKCMGTHPTGSHYEIGENVGITAAQALGERASQLMLRQTHGGGLVTLDKQATDDFGSVQRMFSHTTKTSPMDAQVAPKDGKVLRVAPQKQGGWAIHTTAKSTPFYSKQEPLVGVGHSFRRGDSLTKGDPNMHKLLSASGLGAVQQHMVNRIGSIYGAEGVKQRHVELAVRSSTNTMEITDPGDHPHFKRGDFVQKTVIDEINRTKLQGKKPIQAKTQLKSLAVIPHKTQTNWMGRLMGDHLPGTILEAAHQGGRADMQGRHPIPGLAYGKDFGNPTGGR